MARFLTSPTQKKVLVPLAVTLVLTAYQLVRVIAFIQVYGGIEHDGGWMLSISRSLAEQGTYTTMVSTLPDPTTPGGVGVDQKFDIQAPDGRIWFFTGNGIGPASIVPDALVLKIFGYSFWALRAGPLLFYTVFLLLAAFVLYRLAGLGAVVLFHAYLFFYPHLSIFLSYEAMGEVPSMVYILAAYLAFAAANQKQERRFWAFLGAGLVAGLAINAKLITLWSIGGIFLWAGFGWLIDLFSPVKWPEKRTKLWRRTREITGLSAGTVTVAVLWELVHLVVLTRLTGFDLYRQHAYQRLRFVLDDGSGVGLRIYSGAEFFWDKFFLLAEIAHPQRPVTAFIFLAILLGGLALLWRWRAFPARQTLLAAMWLGWLANTAWFVGLAKTGWPRHFWFGLVLAVMILSVFVVELIKLSLPPIKDSLNKQPALARPGSDWLLALTGLATALLVAWGFASQPHVGGFLLPGEIVPYWQDKQVNNKYHASLPWVIIPRAAQAEIVAYIQQLPPGANVYYPAGHKSAEISPQTGRVQYPLDRRLFSRPHPADVALIGPSLISPWNDPIRRRDLLQLIVQKCPWPAVQNDFYMICPIEQNLPPQP